MSEKVTFEKSGLITEDANKDQIEFWGHDAGEFVIEEEKPQIIEKVEASREEEKSIKE